MATFDENGKYIKTDWKAGDKITANKLNKIEDSLEAINNNDISRHVEADNRLDVIEANMGLANNDVINRINILEAELKAVDNGWDLENYRIESEYKAADEAINKKLSGLETTMNSTDATLDSKIDSVDSSLSNRIDGIAYIPTSWDDFVEALSSNVKVFKFDKNVVYKATTSVTVTNDNVFIDCNNSTIEVLSGTVLTLNGDNITLQNVILEGVSSSVYGIYISGDSCTVTNVRGRNIKYSLIMNNGNNSFISNVVAIECGWDCVSNYTSSKNGIIRDCKAIRTGRHGFSTDTDAENIMFINCYSEDVGYITGEGHTSFHFEGARNCQFIDCVARYTANHKIHSSSFTGGFIGIRNELSTNCSVRNMRIMIDAEFNPANNGMYFLYNEKAELIIDGFYVDNASSFTPTAYLGDGSVYLDNFRFSGNLKISQAAYGGILKRFTNGIINLPESTDESDTEAFYNAKYVCEGMYVNNVRVTGGANIFYGRMVDTIVENSTFSNCVSPIRYGEESTNSTRKSTNNVFRNNKVTNVKYGIRGGWYTGTLNNIVCDCTFSGTIDTLYYCTGGQIVWKNNKAQDLTYTNLSNRDGVMVATNENEIAAQQ